MPCHSTVQLHAHIFALVYPSPDNYSYVVWTMYGLWSKKDWDLSYFTELFTTPLSSLSLSLSYFLFFSFLVSLYYQSTQHTHIPLPLFFFLFSSFFSHSPTPLLIPIVLCFSARDNTNLDRILFLISTILLL